MYTGTYSDNTAAVAEVTALMRTVRDYRDIFAIAISSLYRPANFPTIRVEIRPEECPHKTGETWKWRFTVTYTNELPGIDAETGMPRQRTSKDSVILRMMNGGNGNATASRYMIGQMKNYRAIRDFARASLPDQHNCMPLSALVLPLRGVTLESLHQMPGASQTPNFQVLLRYEDEAGRQIERSLQVSLPPNVFPRGTLTKEGGDASDAYVPAIANGQPGGTWVPPDTREYLLPRSAPKPQGTNSQTAVAPGRFAWTNGDNPKRSRSPRSRENEELRTQIDDLRKNMAMMSQHIQNVHGAISSIPGIPPSSQQEFENLRSAFTQQSQQSTASIFPPCSAHPNTVFNSNAANHFYDSQSRTWDDEHQCYRN